MSSNKTGPRDVFMHLLGIFTLYFSAFGFGTLLFQIINIKIPDVLSAAYYQVSNYQNSIRWALASLIVVFPVYLWVSWFLSREEKKIPEKREMRSRKWLLYFTVFATAAIIIGDLVSLLFSFLQGELTTRFALKVLTILFIAAAIFFYYLWILRREEKAFEKIGIKIFIWSVIGVIIITVIAGFFVAGSPKSERLRRMDEQRVSNLSEIQSEIIAFWQKKNRLPNAIDELRDSISGYVPPKDPESGSSYEYRVLGNLKFELCATFKADAQTELLSSPEKIGPNGQVIQGESWRHPSGRFCFERTIDPAIWKITK